MLKPKTNDEIIDEIINFWHTKSLRFRVSFGDRDSWRKIHGLKLIPFDQANWCLLIRTFDGIEVDYETVLDKISYEEVIRLHIKYDIPIQD